MARSGLIFDPLTGLFSPDTSEIRDGVAQDWTAAFFDPDLPPLDTDPSTPAGQLIDAEVGEIEAKNAELLYLSNQFNPRVADGRWQDALGYIYFLTRKLDEPTIVTCQLTGLNGTVIPYGVLAQSLTGHTLICNRSVTIGLSGTAETTFRVTETGPVEIPAHSVTGILTTIPGWDTIDNAAAGALGRNLETRTEFETRRAASVAANAHGSTGALYGTIANLPGVLDLKILEERGPADTIQFGVVVPGHGVTICVYGGEDADIAEAIYNKLDNGADTGGDTEVVYSLPSGVRYEYNILRPEPVNFWINVTLDSGTILTPAQKEALAMALYTDFYGQNAQSGNPRVGLASTVYASRFYCPALAVPGVNNIKDIGIALSATEPGTYGEIVTIAGDQEPVMSLANIKISSSGYSLTLVGGGGTLLVGRTVNITAVITGPGSVAGQQVRWTAGGAGAGFFNVSTSTTDATGTTTVQFTATAAGAVSLRGTLTSDPTVYGAASLEIEAEPVTYNLAVSSAQAALNIGQSSLITAVLTGTGGAVTSGRVINWAQAGAGTGSFASPTSTTDANGVATVLFTAEGSGALSVTGTLLDVPDVTDSVDITVNEIIYSLTITAEPGEIEVGGDVLVTAILTATGGGAVAGRVIDWAQSGAGAGTFTPASSTTDTNGRAVAVYNTTDAGEVDLYAALQGTSVESSPVRVVIDAVQVVYSLDIESDVTALDSGSVANLTATLSGTAGAEVAGRTISWTVEPSDAGAFAAAASITDAEGEAVMEFTAFKGGMAVIHGTFADEPEVYDEISLEILLRNGVALLGDSILSACRSGAGIRSIVGDGAASVITFTGAANAFKKDHALTIVGTDQEACGNFFVSSLTTGNTVCTVESPFNGTAGQIWPTEPRAKDSESNALGSVIVALAKARVGSNIIQDASLSGSRLTDMVVRMDYEIVPYRPKYVVLMGGTNDVSQSREVADMMADVQTINSKVQAYGGQLIICTIAPVPSNRAGAAALSARTQEYNAALKAFAQENRILFADTGATLVDSNSPEKYGMLAYFTDSLHPNDIGQTLMGAPLEPVLAGLFDTSMPLLPASSTDGGLFPDPFFLNSRAYSTNGFTGTIQQNITMSGAGGAATGTLDIVPADAAYDLSGVGNRQVINFSTTNSTDVVAAFCSVTGNLVVPEDGAICMAMELYGAVSAGSGRIRAYAAPRVNGTTTTDAHNSYAVDCVIGGDCPATAKFYAKSPPFYVKSGTLLTSTYQFVVQFMPSVAGCAGTIRYGRLAYRFIPRAQLQEVYPGDRA